MLPFALVVHANVGSTILRYFLVQPKIPIKQIILHLGSQHTVNVHSEISHPLIPFCLVCDQVILCANSRPTLNDVTYTELLILVKRVAAVSDVIGSALDQGHLKVMESGQGSPCLDLR